MERYVNKPLDRFRGIVKSKKHDYIFIPTLISKKKSFLGIPSSYSYLMLNIKKNTIKISSST